MSPYRGRRLRYSSSSSSSSLLSLSRSQKKSQLVNLRCKMLTPIRSPCRCQGRGIIIMIKTTTRIGITYTFQLPSLATPFSPSCSICLDPITDASSCRNIDPNLEQDATLTFLHPNCHGEALPKRDEAASSYLN